MWQREKYEAGMQGEGSTGKSRSQEPKKVAVCSMIFHIQFLRDVSVIDFYVLVLMRLLKLT